MTPAVAAAERAGITFRLHEYSEAVYGEPDYGVAVARELGPDAVVVVNHSGRGDKDVDTAARWFSLL